MPKPICSIASISKREELYLVLDDGIESTKTWCTEFHLVLLFYFGNWMNCATI